MPRFIARPVVVEAHPFLGDISQWPDAFRLAVVRHVPGGLTEIRTSDGTRPCRYGDWIVRGSDGTFTVMHEATFETMFEEHTAPIVRRAEKRTQLNG